MFVCDVQCSRIRASRLASRVGIGHLDTAGEVSSQNHNLAHFGLPSRYDGLRASEVPLRHWRRGGSRSNGTASIGAAAAPESVRRGSGACSHTSAAPAGL